jgi:hypothetical protein
LQLRPWIVPSNACCSLSKPCSSQGGCQDTAGAVRSASRAGGVRRGLLLAWWPAERGWRLLLAVCGVAERGSAV